MLYKLDNLYFEDSKKAIELLGEKLENPEFPIAKNALVVTNFKHECNDIFSKIESVNEKDKD
jgi:hypothetical protein